MAHKGGPGSACRETGGPWMSRYADTARTWSRRDPRAGARSDSHLSGHRTIDRPDTSGPPRTVWVGLLLSL